MWFLTPSDRRPKEYCGEVFIYWLRPTFLGGAGASFTREKAYPSSGRPGRWHRTSFYSELESKLPIYLQRISRRSRRLIDHTSEWWKIKLQMSWMGMGPSFFPFFASAPVWMWKKKIKVHMAGTPSCLINSFLAWKLSFGPNPLSHSILIYVIDPLLESPLRKGLAHYISQKIPFRKRTSSPSRA